MSDTPRYVLHKHDLPADVKFGDTLAIDSEFMGLNVWRDRLCLLQIYDGKPGSQVHMVQFEKDGFDKAVNVKKLMADASKKKLFFFARGDMRWIGYYLGVILQNVYCLKIASRIARTYTQSHDLEDTVRHVLGVKMSKEQQCTDWGAAELSHVQLDYACSDVLYLHETQQKLDEMIAREGRTEVAEGLFHALPAVVRADLAGWSHEDIFAYHVPKP